MQLAEVIISCHPFHLPTLDFFPSWPIFQLFIWWGSPGIHLWGIWTLAALQLIRLGFSNCLCIAVTSQESSKGCPVKPTSFKPIHLYLCYSSLSLTKMSISVAIPFFTYLFTDMRTLKWPSNRNIFMFSGTYHLVTRISNPGESRVTQAQSSNPKKSLRMRANPTFTPWFGDLSILAIRQVCHRNVLVQCIYSFLENSNQTKQQAVILRLILWSKMVSHRTLCQ